MDPKELKIRIGREMQELPWKLSPNGEFYYLASDPTKAQIKFVTNKDNEVEGTLTTENGAKVIKLISDPADVRKLVGTLSELSTNSNGETMKVKNLKLKKIKLGKYSKVACNSEELATSEIELVPDTEVVAENPDTKDLEVMDVVILDNDKEVVVVEDPKPEDETIKVQDTETKVIADLPVEAFSKSRKVNKGILKAYSESETPKDAPKDEPKAEKIAATIEETDSGFKVKVNGSDPVEVTDKESLMNALASIMDAKGMKDPEPEQNETKISTNSKQRVPFAHLLKK